LIPYPFSLGRLDPEKRLEHLIDAVNILVKEQDNKHEFVLNIVGSGSDEDNLQQQSNRLGLEKNIHFHGYMTYGKELLDKYRDASIFILHSFSEDLPQVLIEAMACGAPVIATNVAGIPYLINDGLNGLLVESAQPRQISKAVLRIIENENLRESLIEKCFSNSHRPYNRG